MRTALVTMAGAAMALTALAAQEPAPKPAAEQPGCHEGNYALSNVLSGERAQEKLRAGAAPAAAKEK